MLLDAFNEFSDSQVVTVTVISTNVHDLGSVPTLRDIGSGETLYLGFQVDVTATAGGAATVTVALETDSDAGLTTSPTIHTTSGALALADLVAGQRIKYFTLPPNRDYERFLGVRYTIATGPLTAGSFSTFLTHTPQRDETYPGATGT